MSFLMVKSSKQRHLSLASKQLLNICDVGYPAPMYRHGCYGTGVADLGLSLRRRMASSPYPALVK
jgi:hypothetical protein